SSCTSWCWRARNHCLPTCSPSSVILHGRHGGRAALWKRSSGIAGSPADIEVETPACPPCQFPHRTARAMILPSPHASVVGQKQRDLDGQQCQHTVLPVVQDESP